MSKRSLGTAAVVLVVLLAAAATASAESRIEKALKLSPGGKLVVQSDAGSVSVIGTDEEGARVVVTSRSDDLESKFDFKFEELPGEVHVTARKKDGSSSWLAFLFTSSPSPRFEVQVPTRTRVEIATGGGGIKAADLEGDAQLSTSGGSISVAKHVGKVAAETSGGGIELQDVRGSASVETSGGSIRAEGIEGSLTGETSGGSIRVVRVRGDLEVSTSGGSIAIEEAGGKVVAVTSGGSISAAFARGNQRGGSLETSGGGIEVRLDPGVNLNLEARASGGSVVSDLPVKVVGEARRSSLTGTLGSGGATLTLQTSGGSVRIGGVQEPGRS